MLSSATEIKKKKNGELTRQVQVPENRNFFVIMASIAQKFYANQVTPSGYVATYCNTQPKTFHLRIFADKQIKSISCEVFVTRGSHDVKDFTD